MPRSASASRMRRIWARSSGLVLLVGAQELGGDRRIDRLAPTDVVEIVVALERLVLADFGDHGVDLRRRRGLPDRVQNTRMLSSPRSARCRYGS